MRQWIVYLPELEDQFLIELDEEGLHISYRAEPGDIWSASTTAEETT